MGSGHENMRVGLTLEDDFTLQRLKNGARALEGEARNQYLWKAIFRFVCRERAYKSVMEQIGVVIETNIDIFDDEAEN